MLSVYPHLFNPESHPDYAKRPTHPISRLDLEESIQFTSLRVFTIDNNNMLVRFREDLSLYAEELDIGKIIWPFNKALFADNLEELAREIVSRGYWLFDFWGYVPGSDPRPPAWGQYQVPESVGKMLRGVLGHRFLGMDNGEQDGRYIGSYAPSACPASTDRRQQLISFYRHFDRMGEDLGDRISVLCSLNFPHYFARQSTTTILGAETAQALINANLWYAYIRGAGKQHGLLWFGNASIWNRWGYKSYESSGGQGNYTWGPNSGTTLSLLERLLYTEYLYNCDILGFEQSWVLGDNTEKRIEGQPTLMDTDDSTRVLTPVGQLQVEAKSKIREWGYPGPMHTPIAILMDWANGWVPPRHLYTNRTHLVWGNLPYGEADYQVHALFTMLYPGYEDSGFYKDERGFLTGTPFTDIADVLFTDVRTELLSAYNLIVLAGEQHIDAELSDKLTAYVKGGGRLVMFRQALQSSSSNSYLNTEWTKALSTCCNDDSEPYHEVALGQGVIYLISSLYGLYQLAPLPGHPLANNTDDSLPLFYDFANSVKHLLTRLFEEQRLVWTDNPNLMTIVNLASEISSNKVTISVANNTDSIQSFTINTRLELNILSKTLLFGRGITEDTCLEPGGMAIFRLELGLSDAEGTLTKTLVTKPPITFKSARDNLRCNLGKPTSLKETLVQLPTLPHTFTGVKIDGRYLKEHDAEYLALEGKYLRQNGLSLTVDLSSMINLFPELTLIDNIPGAFESSMSELTSLIDKASKLGADSLVIALHRVPENHIDRDTMLEQSKAGIIHISKAAQQHDMKVFLQHSPWRPLENPSDMMTFIYDLCRHRDLSNLRFSLNFSHAILSGIKLPEMNDTGVKEVGMALLSVPSRDGFGQLFDTHSPTVGSPWEEVVIKHAQTLLDSGVTVCIDVSTSQNNQITTMWNAIYRDAARLTQ